MILKRLFDPILIDKPRWRRLPIGTRFGALIAFLGLIQLLSASEPARSQSPPSPFAKLSDPTQPSVNFKTVGENEVQVITGLEVGWNLVSFQVLPGDRSPESVLASLKQGGSNVDPAAAVDSLWCYDSQNERWITWSPGAETNVIPGLGISEIDYFQGYWLKLNLSNLSLEIAGQPPSDGRVTLYPGWNFVAFDGAGDADDFLADVQSVFGTNADTVDPANSRIRLVYLLTNSLQGDPLIWDPFNDREIGDTTMGLPPGNEPGVPNADTLLSFARGTGYWVLVNEGVPVVLQPVLRVILPADSDVDPTGNFPGPEDFDIDGDGAMDSSTWTFPDPETAGVQDSLVFPTDAVQREILVRNAGNGILSWRAYVDPAAADWLSLEPGQGKLLRGTDRISVMVSRGSLPGPDELLGMVNVETTGGTRAVDVKALIPDLEGDYTGRAQMSVVDGKNIPMPSLDLFVSLERASDGTLRGLIGAEESLSVPVDIPLSGDNYRASGSDFTISGAYSLPGSDRDSFNINDFNPLPGDLRRELRFTGLRTSENILSGVIHDTLHGVLDRPINVAGNFVLERISLAPTKGEGALANWDPVGGTFLTETRRFAVNIPTRTLVESVRAMVDIDHPRTSDMEIWLEGPSTGKGAPVRVLLFDHAPGVGLETSWPDLSFPAGGADALDAFQGIVGQGDWVLEITDNVDGPGEQQRLRAFQLEVRGPTVHSVQGTVTDSQANPLPGAFVGITGGVFTPYTITGPDGSFFFDFLTSNLYKATASRFGYGSINGAGQASFFLDDNLSGVDLVLTKKSPAAANLLIAPSQAVAPAEVRLTYVSNQSPGPASFQFVIQQYDFSTGSPIGGQVTMDSGPEGEVLYTNLSPGVYDVGVTPQGGGILTKPGAITIRPTAALQTPTGSFRLAGSFGVGGGVIPGVYTPPNANPGFPQVSNVPLNEHMADATTFDNDRLSGDGLFPVDSGSSDPFDQVDTDVRSVGPVPPTHLAVLGVGRISYSLLEGERGGNLDFDPCAVEEGQTWGCFRITTSMGATISGFSEAGALSLVGGGRPFPPDWGPNGGQP
jgi:subtilisin-like proprotein convertase family protein